MRSSIRIVLFMVAGMLLPATAESSQSQTPVGPLPRQSAGGQQKADKGNERVVLDTHLVSVNVTVTDSYGRFVTGLDRQYFDLFDDKVRQEIGFFSDEDAPVS